MYHEHDVVVLRRDLPENGLLKDDVGAIVGMYATGAYEVEFTTADGATVVLTLKGKDISPQHSSPTE